MSLGRDVGLGPGDIVLDGDPAAPRSRKGAQHPPRTFWRMSIVAKRSPISATAELLFLFVYEISRKPLNGFAPNSRGDVLDPCSDEFERQGQRSSSPGTKTAFAGPFGGLRAVRFW